MDTKKQRQHRRNNMRLTKSGNARSEQLLVVPTELLTNREWLPGELLSGSERRRPGWFLEISTLCTSGVTLSTSLSMWRIKLLECHLTLYDACTHYVVGEDWSPPTFTVSVTTDFQCITSPSPPSLPFPSPHIHPLTTHSVFQSPHLLGEPVSPVLRIHHNNQTGRWLTPFRAEWDPSSDEYFIVGSLTHPRQVTMVLWL